MPGKVVEKIENVEKVDVKVVVYHLHVIAKVDGQMRIKEKQKQQRINPIMKFLVYQNEQVQNQLKRHIVN